jgi:hypothetical protein
MQTTRFASVATDRNIICADPKVTYLDPEIRWQVEFLRSLRPATRRSCRYEDLIRVDNGFREALKLAQNAHYVIGHDTLSNGDMLVSDRLRPVYLRYLLGICLGALEICNAPPHRARKLLAAILFLNHGWNARSAKSLACRVPVHAIDPFLESAEQRGRQAVTCLRHLGIPSESSVRELAELLAIASAGSMPPPSDN